MKIYILMVLVSAIVALSHSYPKQPAPKRET